MAIELVLKKRDTKGSIQVPFDLLKGIIDKGDKDELMSIMGDIAKTEPYVHDVHWLETIINWVPQGGLPIMQMSMWFKLAQRVSELDPTREGPFTLSEFQGELIWNRLNDERFVVQAMPQQFIDFIMGFAEAAGKELPEESGE